MLAVDVSPWLRSDAPTSAELLFCHVYGRAKNQAQLIPGWPYSFVAALEPGRTSWTAVLDVVRLGPADDATAVTAGQLRAVVGRLIAAGHWRDGDPDILIVMDAGYDVTRLAFVPADLPVELLGRIRSDRVLRLPKPPRLPGATGRPPKHGPEFALDKPATWPEPQHTTTVDTTRYGTAKASSWDRLHPRLTHRTCWIDHEGDLPVIEGTLIRLQVDHLPGDRDPKPVWLWSSATSLTADEVDRPGRRSSEDSTLSTPSGCSSTPSAGRSRRSATRRQLTVDLAHHRGSHSAPPRPAPRRRPPPPLGEAGPARPAHPRPSSTRVPEHPSQDRPPGQRAETQQAWPRTPARLQEPQPSTPLRRREDRQTRPHHDSPTTPHRLKIKLRAC
jgi:hypothetical protein